MWPSMEFNCQYKQKYGMHKWKSWSQPRRDIGGFYVDRDCEFCLSEEVFRFDEAFQVRHWDHNEPIEGEEVERELRKAGLL